MSIEDLPDEMSGGYQQVFTYSFTTIDSLIVAMVGLLIQDDVPKSNDYSFDFFFTTSITRFGSLIKLFWMYYQ